MSTSQQIQPDLFSWAPTPAAPSPMTTPRTPGRTCPISCRGAITGPTADLPTLVVDLNGKEVLL